MLRLWLTEQDYDAGRAAVMAEWRCAHRLGSGTIYNVGSLDSELQKCRTDLLVATSQQEKCAQQVHNWHYDVSQLESYEADLEGLLSLVETGWTMPAPALAGPGWRKHFDLGMGKLHLHAEECRGLVMHEIQQLSRWQDNKQHLDNEVADLKQREAHLKMIRQRAAGPCQHAHTKQTEVHYGMYDWQMLAAQSEVPGQSNRGQERRYMQPAAPVRRFCSSFSLLPSRKFAS